jgi:hypothetical protein
MIFDDIDRPVTQEHARVELEVLFDEIGYDQVKDTASGSEPANRRRPCARVFVLSMTG